ncbi:hypothetical protein [Algoriphagus marincola]|uniref:hypothetical protein n=1 Tax=Algoriphagus marincola TaxID=264027 RepID=UPI00047E5523|nr:hypothetical protein [Algoriphagus marincola]
MKIKSYLMFSYMRIKFLHIFLLGIIACESSKDLKVDEKVFKPIRDTLEIGSAYDSALFYANGFSEWVQFEQNDQVSFFHTLGRAGLLYSLPESEEFKYLPFLKPDTIGLSITWKRFFSPPLLDSDDLFFLRQPNELVIYSFKNHQKEVIQLQNLVFTEFKSLSFTSSGEILFLGRQSHSEKWILGFVENETNDLEKLTEIVLPDYSQIDFNESYVYLNSVKSPEYYRLDLNSYQLDTIPLTGLSQREFFKKEKPDNFLSLPMVDRIKFVEDYPLDIVFLDDYYFELSRVFRADPDGKFEKCLLLANYKGKTYEKVLPKGFLNFDDFGNIYSIAQSEVGYKLITNPVLDFFPELKIIN